MPSSRALCCGVIGVGFFIPALTLAQPRLELIDAFREVEASHPSIIAKREELRAAERLLSAARQQRMPTLSVQTSRPNTVNAASLNVARLQQPLYAGGRIDAGIERAEAQLDEVRSGLEATTRDLLNRTASSFLDVVKGDARLRVADRNVAEHRRLLESIGRRVGAEISPESDLMLTRSRLSQAETERLQIVLSLRRAQDSLTELLSRQSPTLAAPEGPHPPAFVDLEAAIAAGLAFSPEVRRAEALQRMAAAEFDAAKALALPSVFVRHEQMVGGLEPGYQRSQTYVGIEFLPGAGISTASQVQAADNRRRSAIESRRAAEKELKDRIRALWAESESLARQLESATGYVEASQAVAESFSRQFTIGRKTWLELLNAVRESLLAELSLIEISWNLRLAHLRLETETGKIFSGAPPAIERPTGRPQP